jgi:hypothetical protein
MVSIPGLFDGALDHKTVNYISTYRTKIQQALFYISQEFVVVYPFVALLITSYCALIRCYAKLS